MLVDHTYFRELNPHSSNPYTGDGIEQRVDVYSVGIAGVSKCPLYPTSFAYHSKGIRVPSLAYEAASGDIPCKIKPRGTQFM